MKTFAMTILLAVACLPAFAREYHVSVSGNDSNDGTADKPLKTISVAAQLAQPGDTVTVHAGTYRERISPPRGGSSDTQRITYQAAPGEKVAVKGSEIVKDWQKVQNDTWKAVVPNTLFGSYNPYSDKIHGDWFSGKGRDHHTGAVYLKEHWLTEAATLDEVLMPVGTGTTVLGRECLLNIAWLRPGKNAGNAEKTPATAFAAQQGTQNAPCSEGGQCIGWIEHGDWVKYERVDFKQGTEQLEIRAASATGGGIIEIRLDAPNGELLGTCTVSSTGDWQSWSSFVGKIKPVSGVKTLCLVFKNPKPAAKISTPVWFAAVDDKNTTIHAQFPGVNPNETEVEINVRRAVFYPEKPGMNYITVRGFTMMHAATQWAPPTAEQIGLIGTHWSKGWIIENNDIRYSVCVGVTLGKHGDEFDNTSQDTAEGYVKTIERAHQRGWTRENIGHHIVRNNRIAHCEQAGIVGSMGAAFCTVTGNVIHDIHVRMLFTGAEMAGIKFHAAIDTEISHNYIHHACRGIWLDWMTQGTHVVGNLFHDNQPNEDLMVEVNHGPFLVENNIFLSPRNLFDMSQGGAYVHNLFAGRLSPHPEMGRDTPYHKAHSTEIAGMQKTPGGDDRFFNNIFVNSEGLAAYDKATLPMMMAGNVFLKGAKAGKAETSPLVQADFDPGIKLETGKDGAVLHIALDKTWAEKQPHAIVTTELLGKAKHPDLPYEQPDGKPYRLDKDYFGKARNAANPFPGPFEFSGEGTRALNVWPKATSK